MTCPYYCKDLIIAIRKLLRSLEVDWWWWVAGLAHTSRASGGQWSKVKSISNIPKGANKATTTLNLWTLEDATLKNISSFTNIVLVCKGSLSMEFLTLFYDELPFLIASLLIEITWKGALSMTFDLDDTEVRSSTHRRHNLEGSYVQVPCMICVCTYVHTFTFHY